jgi:AcrR family transcriptional regulator
LAQLKALRERRPSLTRAGVLDAAVRLADRDGIDGLSMRRLGQELGVEAMALYRHVRNKDELLDAAVEAVIAEIPPPETATGDWKASVRTRAMAARLVMLRHPWAPPVIVGRSTVGPALLAHLDGVMGDLRAGGFSVPMAHHALHVLGSRVLGFTQDPFDDAADPRPDPATAAAQARALAVHYPNLGELALAVSHEGGLGGCDDDVEFAFGLDLILDGLDRRRSD